MEGREASQYFNMPKGIYDHYKIRGRKHTARRCPVCEITFLHKDEALEHEKACDAARETIAGKCDCVCHDRPLIKVRDYLPTTVVACNHCFK